MSLQEENKRLHCLNTKLHEKNHFLSLKQAEIQELIDAKEVKSEELLNKVDDLEYEFGKCRMRNEKLEAALMETQVREGNKQISIPHKQCPFELNHAFVIKISKTHLTRGLQFNSIKLLFL
ncbi:E3 ubiquitinprotein ligase Bre1like [Caligus rogercresseyi]|uniref:E3 ubiquitinprotein ligase Bre1like n=1 Tax=Caligus rogercresseyi TaxID=217165 RepID=A0A7T8KEU1_CALRO|nr:E3 ubiquitinprotein ligase Bre1like [Caligus rogercresseyi]